MADSRRALAAPWLACWLALATPAGAENFVLNGGFELPMSTCVSNFGQVARAPFWATPITSSDLFNSCFPGTSGVGTTNLFGDESPFEGEGYAGFIAINKQGHHHEYLQTSLSAPLVAGLTYDVSFQISLADTSGWATADIGVVFMDSPVYPTVLPPIQSLPMTTIDVVHGGPAITETSGWTEFRGTYTATGGERFMLIGNFVPYATTTPAAMDLSNPGGTAEHWAYYYVDHVRVTGCRDLETRIDMDSLAFPGTTTVSLPEPHVEDGFLFGDLVEVLVRGDADPLYTGTPAIQMAAADYWLRRGDGMPFEVCSFEAAADPNVGSPSVEVTATGPTFVFPISSASPVLETVRSDQLGDETDWYFNQLGQIDDLCLCTSGTCDCESVVELESQRFCVQGPSAGVNWGWELSGAPLVNALTPGLAALPRELAESFARSINDSGPANASAMIDRRDLGCFYVAYDAGFTLSVGPENGPVNCIVSANPTGCSFNPVLLDGAFLPPSPGSPFAVESFRTPALLPGAVWGVVASIAVAGAVAAGRARRRR